jgi:predicted transcriptional regulator/ADP-ribose pyrophosphatase YjhB (NUDIX family)
MDIKNKLHPAQASILYYLRHNPEARYSELMRTTTLESDVFKFHIRKLISEGLLEKTDAGMYHLTAPGKEYANRVDEKNRHEIAFPKTSMLIVVTHKTDGQTYYLAHQRKRDPFMGYWGVLSGPLPKGRLSIDAAKSELLKQAGIIADLQVCGTIRTIDKNEADDVLEDKIFVVLNADLPSRETPHQWHAGQTAWMTRDELLVQKPLFNTTTDVFRMLDSDEHFIESVQSHSVEAY